MQLNRIERNRRGFQIDRVREIRRERIRIKSFDRFYDFV